MIFCKCSMKLEKIKRGHRFSKVSEKVLESIPRPFERLNSYQQIQRLAETNPYFESHVNQKKNSVIYAKQHA